MTVEDYESRAISAVNRAVSGHVVWAKTELKKIIRELFTAREEIADKKLAEKTNGPKSGGKDVDNTVNIPCNQNDLR